MLSLSGCSIKSSSLNLIPSPTIHWNFHKRLLCNFRRHWSTLARARTIINSSKGLSAMESKESSDGGIDGAITGFNFLAQKPYSPPPWASHLSPIPSHVFSLGHRDDLSGMQLSGNKVRRLEFLLADAVAQGADCIITIGDIQSNHCCATAVAAKYLNLDCHLILCTSKALVDKDPGLTGNLLVERLVGAHAQPISEEEYAKLGSVTLTELLKEKLPKKGRKPYVIPVGGSNSLGTW